MRDIEEVDMVLALALVGCKGICRVRALTSVEVKIKVCSYHRAVPLQCDLQYVPLKQDLLVRSYIKCEIEGCPPLGGDSLVLSIHPQSKVFHACLWF